MSITPIDSKTLINNVFPAYDMIFVSDGLNIEAQITLPPDYNSGKDYPLALYFPETNIITENNVYNFAANNISLITLVGRGSGKSEGQRDYGGADYKDAVACLKFAKRSVI